MSDRKIEVKAGMTQGDNGEIKVVIASQNASIRLTYTDRKELATLMKTLPGAMDKLFDGFAEAAGAAIPDTIPFD